MNSSALYVEIGGDRLRRLDDGEAPLKLILQLLADLGVDDEAEAKNLATDVGLESVVKFFMGEFSLKVLPSYFLPDSFTNLFIVSSKKNVDTVEHLYLA